MPDRLSPRWQQSASPDVAGYLVYRNGRLANASGVVLGDLRTFLVPGLTYGDPSLPDGAQCYRVVAMDRAGNSSPPSNEICRALDNHPPHALILQPAEGTRFEFPVRVVATTSDLDVASLQFQYKPAAAETWINLGAVLGRGPYQATLDPAAAALVPGPCTLRAVATDDTGHVDPSPDEVHVAYGDVTPPRAPVDAVTHVDGQRVTVTWSASGEPDLAGYRMYRDGQRTFDAVTETNVVDFDVPLGRHEYAVTAVDNDGNESVPGAIVPAIVYALVARDPFPITAATTATVSGTERSRTRPSRSSVVRATIRRSGWRRPREGRERSRCPCRSIPA